MTALQAAVIGGTAACLVPSAIAVAVLALMDRHNHSATPHAGDDSFPALPPARDDLTAPESTPCGKHRADRFGVASTGELPYLTEAPTVPVDPAAVIAEALKRTPPPAPIEQPFYRPQLAGGLLGLDANADTTPSREPVADWARTERAA